MDIHPDRRGRGSRSRRRRRRPGCFALPFALALRVYRPGRPGRVSDSAIEAAQILRTSIGLAATFWLVYRYPLQESASAFALDRFSDAFIAAGVLAVAGPVALIAFVLAARSPRRRLFARRLGTPLGGFAALFGSGLVVYTLLREDAGMRLTGHLGLLRFPGLIALLVLVLFTTAFGLASVVLSVHYVFRVGDVHEVLPPLLSPLLAWATCAFQACEDSPVAAPASVRLLFLIGPPLSVSALSVWELGRLRRLYGVTVRGALGR
ncbi:hypothetical protein ACIQU4_27770 [Streptomyces sp. NPDC090741]|uniref:hypothetical protein n=1 Tax=Streptomyces sp. NPDC090741 TaxID=3365967 RepID=UPI0038074DF0